MILVDMNQISVASVMMHLHMNKTNKPDGDMVRHMILNSLRMYRTRFCGQYGELILCYDSKHYWRREYTKLIVRRVERSQRRIGMLSLVVSMRLNKSLKTTFPTNIWKCMVQKQTIL